MTDWSARASMTGARFFCAMATAFFMPQHTVQGRAVTATACGAGAVARAAATNPPLHLYAG